MKINEVIQEAINTSTGTPNGNTSIGQKASNFVKGFIPGTDANKMRQAQQAAKPKIQANKQNVQLALAQWQTYMQDRGATTDFKNPENYKHELEQWANARFPSAAGSININTVNPQTPGTVVKYISDIYSTAMANRVVNKTPGNTTNVGTDVLNKLITQAEAAGNRISPDEVSTELATLQMTPIDRREFTSQIINKLKGYGIEVINGPHGTGAGEAPTLSPGVAIVSSDPVVLGYDKRKYALNSQNRWVVFGGSKPASAEMARFLNKQMQAL